MNEILSYLITSHKDRNNKLFLSPIVSYLGVSSIKNGIIDQSNNYDFYIKPPYVIFLLFYYPQDNKKIKIKKK